MEIVMINNMVVAICYAGYIMLPGFISNMAAVVVGKYLPLGPIDFGRTARDGQRLLGETKSWGGLLGGTLCGWAISLAIYALLRMIPGGFSEIGNSLTKLEQHAMILMLAGGALVGDIVESYIKRRRKFPSGYQWRPWDQVDQILGSLVFGLFTYGVIRLGNGSLISVERLDGIAVCAVAALSIPLTIAISKGSHKAGIKPTI